MAAVSITLRAYDALKEQFRREDMRDASGAPNFRHVSAAANCETALARKAWLSGFPKQNLLPIRLLFEQEATAARKELQLENANLAVRTRKDQELAFKHAVASRVEEGELVGLSRRATMANLRTAEELSSAARQFAPVLRDYIENSAESIRRWVEYERRFLDGDVTAEEPQLPKAAMTLNQGLDLLSRLAALTKQIVETAKQAMELERLHMGHPDTQAKENTPTSAMTLNEAVARAEAVKNAVTFYQKEKVSDAEFVDDERLGEVFAG